MIDRDQTQALSTDDVAKIISRLCVGVIVIATILGEDIEDNTDKKPRHKPKGKWRFREI